MASHMAYADPMARKQVLAQLDDRTVKELDRRAKKQGVSRSELIRRAVAEHLRDLDWEEKDRVTVEAYRRMPEDPKETEAMGRIALETWPEG